MVRDARGADFDRDFMLTFMEARKADGFTDEDLEGMPVPEFVDFIGDWLRTNQG